MEHTADELIGSNISKAKSNCSAIVRRIDHARIQAHPNDWRPSGWFSRTRSVQALLISSAIRLEPKKFVISVPANPLREKTSRSLVRGGPDIPAQVSVGRQIAIRNRDFRIEDQCRSSFPANQICVCSHTTMPMLARVSMYEH